MAKGKSSTSAKAASSSVAPRKSSAAAKGESNSTPKKSTDSSPAISGEQIGEVAGRVWQYLDREGGQSVAAIKKATNDSNDLVLAAIGWLAREDKLEFSLSGRTVKISLR